jgi:hypothetical protein
MSRISTPFRPSVFDDPIVVFLFESLLVFAISFAMAVFLARVGERHFSLGGAIVSAKNRKNRNKAAGGGPDEAGSV